VHGMSSPPRRGRWQRMEASHTTPLFVLNADEHGQQGGTGGEAEHDVAAGTKNMTMTTSSSPFSLSSVVASGRSEGTCERRLRWSARAKSARAVDDGRRCRLALDSGKRRRRMWWGCGDAARRRAGTSHGLTVSRGGISQFFISKCIGGIV
jgi:hypothetical protein